MKRQKQILRCAQDDSVDQITSTFTSGNPISRNSFGYGPFVAAASLIITSFRRSALNAIGGMDTSIGDFFGPTAVASLVSGSPRNPVVDRVHQQRDLLLAELL